jgi:catechol 2,3-dioxygenase-like lactoylglutathione lyase family enzyme
VRAAVFHCTPAPTEVLGLIKEDPWAASALLEPRQLRSGEEVGGIDGRVARQTGRLDDIVTFYRDGLGLPQIDHFTGHAGHDGVMLDLPGTGAHLEFTATEHTRPPTPHAEDLLVLYLGDQSLVDRVLTRLAATPVPSTNPYWDQIGVTIVDPDGFRVVLVSQTWQRLAQS